MEFLKANWAILVQVFIAIVAIIAMYHIYHKAKSEREKEKKEKLGERVATLEGKMDTLISLHPKLEKAEESLKKLDNLKTPEDIKKTVSEILKTTDITPEAISTGIKEEVGKKFSDIDKGIATIIAQKLDEIDERFKKPIGDASDYLILGNAEYEKENYPKAIEYYEKALKINPNHAYTLNNKGIALGKLKKHDEAIKCFDKAIEIKPDFAGAWTNKGIALDKLGQREEALKAFDKAIEIKPDDADAWYNKACCYSLMKDKKMLLKTYPEQ